MDRSPFRVSVAYCVPWLKGGRRSIVVVVLVVFIPFPIVGPIELEGLYTDHFQVGIAVGADDLLANPRMRIKADLFITIRAICTYHRMVSFLFQFFERQNPCLPGKQRSVYPSSVQKTHKKGIKFVSGALALFEFCDVYVSTGSKE
jgi:hypothetical protein